MDRGHIWICGGYPECIHDYSSPRIRLCRDRSRWFGYVMVSLYVPWVIVIFVNKPKKKSITPLYIYIEFDVRKCALYAQKPGKRVAFGSILGTCFAAHVSEEDGLHEWSPLAISGRFHMRSFWAVACGLVAVAWKSHKWQAAMFALVWRALLLKQKQLFLPLLPVPGLLRKTSPVPIAMKFPLPNRIASELRPFIPFWATLFFVKVKALWQCGKRIT